MHGLVWQLSGEQTSGENLAGLHCYEHHGLLAMLQCTRWLHSARAAASLSRTCCYPGTVDGHSDDYVTTFNCVGCLWRRRSYALVIQTMRLRGLLYACSWVTITNRIVNTGTRKLNSNLEIKLRIFELRVTTLLTLLTEWCFWCTCDVMTDDKWTLMNINDWWQ